MSLLADILDPRDLARAHLMHPANFRYAHLVQPRRRGYRSAEDAVARAIEQGNLAEIPEERMMQLYEQLRWEPRSSKLAIAMDTYLMRRDRQHEVMRGLNVHALLELISQGFLPGELSEAYGVSYSVIHGYLESACEGTDAVERALQLCADMQAYKGLQDISEASEHSKAGVQKGVELAKQRMVIARALNPKRYSEKPLPVPVGGGGGSSGGAWLVLDVTSNLGGYANPPPVSDPTVVDTQGSRRHENAQLVDASADTTGIPDTTVGRPNFIKRNA